MALKSCSEDQNGLQNRPERAHEFFQVVVFPNFNILCKLSKFVKILWRQKIFTFCKHQLHKEKALSDENDANAEQKPNDY